MVSIVLPITITKKDIFDPVIYFSIIIPTYQREISCTFKIRQYSQITFCILFAFDENEDRTLNAAEHDLLEMSSSLVKASV